MNGGEKIPGLDVNLIELHDHIQYDKLKEMGFPILQFIHLVDRR